jgi:hypothetical protein
LNEDAVCMTAEIRCATCDRKFAGDRSEVIRLLWCHTILHDLQATVRQRLTELADSERELSI